MFKFNTGNVIFLPEDSSENILKNKKAKETIARSKDECEQLVGAYTKGRTEEVLVYGRVDQNGNISGRRYYLANQLDRELVRQFKRYY